MNCTLTRDAVAAVLALFFSYHDVSAQQPSPNQVAAIRASCRSDFIANCSGVQPGGKDALECLERNLTKLSGSCKTAVGAVIPPPEAAPSPTATAPSLPPATEAPSPSPVSSPREKPQHRKSTVPASAPAAAAAPAPAVAPLTVRPFILPQRRLVIVTICRFDVSTLCSDVPAGGERILKCLAAQAANLSPNCYAAIARVSRR